MTALRIDEQGRVLLPKEWREALGLSAGSLLEADWQSGQVVLRAPTPARLVSHEGRLVVQTADLLESDPVADFRDSHLQQLGEW